MVNNRYIFLIIALLAVIGTVGAATQVDEFADTGIWTAPSGVNTIELDLCGAGSGGMGGYLLKSTTTTVTGVGPGGLAGECIHQGIVSVTPGSSYTITIGTQGQGESGIYLAQGGAVGVYNGSCGSPSSAFGYTADAASCGMSNLTVTSLPASGTPVYTVNGDTNGESSGVGSFYVAQDGDSGPGGYGDTAGIGWGAGGGGGGAGAAPSSPGGSGGDGGQGYARITYNSDSLAVWLRGYVMSAETGGALSGASVQATQLSASSSDTSDASGYYEISAAKVVGYPITITTSKTGYNSSVTSFSPPTSGVLSINQSILSLTPSGTNITVGSIVRSPPYYSPSNGAVLHIWDVANGTVSNATCNIAGYAKITALLNNYPYKLWASYGGYNSTVLDITSPTG